MTLRGGHREDTHASSTSKFTIVLTKSGLVRVLIHIGSKWVRLRYMAFIACAGRRRRQDPMTIRSETLTGFTHSYTFKRGLRWAVWTTIYFLSMMTRSSFLPLPASAKG